MSHLPPSLLLALLFTACTGPAYDPGTGIWTPQPGDLLFHAAGSYADRKYDDQDQLAIAVQGGASLVASETYELGLDLTVTSFDSTAGDARAALLAARYSYLLDPTQYGRPYAGVHAGFYDVKSPTDDGSDPAFGLHLGLRQCWHRESACTSSHASPRPTRCGTRESISGSS